jgi:SAM-dependent methyltransferase
MSQGSSASRVGPAEVWKASAAGWVRNADFLDRLSAPVREWIVERLDPQPGQVVLELAAGAGDTGFQVAEKLGPEGRLISTDIAPAMLDAAKERARRRGLGNVEFRVMDAQAIDLEANSVDGVIHRYGPMLLPDPEASFSGVRRVLKAGGKYICVVWAGPDRNPWIPAGGMALMQNGIEIQGEPFGPGGMFSLADPEALKGRIAGAGFDDVEVEERENPFEFSSFEEIWKIPSEIAGPLAVLIAGLDEDHRERVKESFRNIVGPFRSGKGYRPPALSLCVVAR